MNDEPARPTYTAASVARVFYTAYCEAVGGVAFNGDPLPTWGEFFADPAKRKQADAYLAGGMAILDFLKP